MKISEISKAATKATQHGLHDASKLITHEGHALSKALKFAAVAGVVRDLAHTLEPLGSTDGVLGLVGLRRRRSMFSQVMSAVGIIAASAAVGAGIVLLVTPQTGPQVRDRLTRMFN